MVMDQTSKEYHLQDVSEAEAQCHSPGPPNAQRERPRLHIGPRVRDGRVGSPTLVVLVVVGRRRRGSHVSAVLHFREMQSNWGCCLLGGGLKKKKLPYSHWYAGHKFTSNTNKYFCHCATDGLENAQVRSYHFVMQNSLVRGTSYYPRSLQQRRALCICQKD